MKRILSTKLLSIGQKELLLNAGFSFVDYNAIEIHPLKFEMPGQIDNAIFTSSNSVDIFFENKPENLSVARVFCVGPKTAQKLTELRQNVVKIAQNGAELGEFIQKTIENEDFHFFCGTLRKEDLPERVKFSKNRLFELKIYETGLKKRKFDQKFDGIMFFSPSGVKSYTIENNLENKLAFCIGESTASEAKKHTSEVHIANQTTVESVIAKTVKILRTND